MKYWKFGFKKSLKGYAPAGRLYYEIWIFFHFGGLTPCLLHWWDEIWRDKFNVQRVAPTGRKKLKTRSQSNSHNKFHVFQLQIPINEYTQ